MSARTLGWLPALLLAACSAGPDATLPPPAADSTSVGTEVARFRDARAVAADPAGRLYVADAAESTVTVLSPLGVPLATFGGPGTGDYGFLDPSGIDPTNGLELFVADASNARIQRFSHDGLLVETIPVPAGDPEVVRPETGRPRGTPGVQGRPVAVAVGPAQTLYAIEAERGVVLRWEGGRRLAQRLGSASDGAGALAEPVGLVVSSEGTVFVADRAREAVLVYDALGTFRRAVPGTAAGGVVGVALAASDEGERLLVVGPQAVAIHRVGGGLVEVLPFPIGESLVAAAVARDGLYVLTPTRLLRAD